MWREECDRVVSPIVRLLEFLTQAIVNGELVYRHQFHGRDTERLQVGDLLDYAEIIDAATFEVAEDSTENCRAIVAGWINGIRLIDNMAMSNLGDFK